MLKVLFIATKHDYSRSGKVSSRVYSHDYFVWYSSMKKIDSLEVKPFWFYEQMKKNGKAKMNEELIQFAKDYQPDVAIFSVGSDEVDKETIQTITKELGITTAYICGDDTWRFDSVSKHFAPFYTWVLTNYTKTIPKYKKLGCRNIIYYNGWANLDFFKPGGGEKDIDVSFVGTWSKRRGRIIEMLQRAGINVEVYGNGWPSGAIDQDQFVSLTQRSRISLILNGSAFYFGLKPIARLFFKRPGIGSKYKRLEPDFKNFFSNLREWLQKRRPQIKGRIFEVGACRSMQITDYAEDLEEVYDLEDEIILYKSDADLVKKIKYYLNNDAERERLAKNAYERTLRDRSPVARLTYLFKSMGYTI